ncbi:hypothetical protein [Helicobacter acinonychis]|uniref:GP-PDE domain-containing protein n=1 Tax=Helicobacter acinonychis (strain Sheeba) TaxID=382638 RepID=Q17WP1_HELAH|nr:hypothetical protein [Helicobacter acinonychis]CAJ99935.1 conserved hypothetical protein [Helicobacter acinonychis str. Sheeba]STP04484.1 Uncharacterised protein [Helicobacter acinonychis]
MLILGHPLIPSPRFIFIKNTDDIHSSTNNDIVYFEAHPKNLELAKYCFENSVNFSVVFLLHKTETDIFFLFNAFKPHYYIFKDIKQAITAQSHATNYLLDSKILFSMDLNDTELWEICAKNQIDGVISKDLILLK